MHSKHTFGYRRLKPIFSREKDERSPCTQIVFTKEVDLGQPYKQARFAEMLNYFFAQGLRILQIQLG